MLSIAVCDDDRIFCTLFEEQIIKINKELNIKTSIETFLSGETLCDILSQGKRFDIIFLDIELQTMNGVDIGKMIRDGMNDEVTKIVYISGRDSYAMELFEVRLFDFLIKPIQDEKLEKILKLVDKLIDEENKDYIFKNGRKIKKVPYKDILFFESDDKKVKIITAKENQEFYAKLSDIEKTLKNNDFIFIHKSYLVNARNVIEYKYDILKMCNEEMLPISRKYREKARDYFLQYYDLEVGER